MDYVLIDTAGRIDDLAVKLAEIENIPLIITEKVDRQGDFYHWMTAYNALQ